MPAVETLIVPVLSVMGVAFVFNAVLRSLNGTRLASPVLGLLFGLAIMLAMSYPIRLSDALFYDLRGLLVGVAVVFAGPVAGAVTLVIAATFRVYLGGSGVEVALIELALGFGLGVVWRGFCVGRIAVPLLADAAFGLYMSLVMVGLFWLPFDLALTVLLQIGGSMVIGNVLGAIGLCHVLRRELRLFENRQQLEASAMIDPLTNLLNRRGAAERRAALTRHPARGHAVLFFDLDRFKTINDTFGHAAGDLVLATVAERVRDKVREEAVVARHGGDEFTIYLGGVDHGTAIAIARRVCSAMADTPVMFEDKLINLSVSLGAYWSARPKSFDTMLDRADAALSQAKQKGRNRYVVSHDDRPLQPVTADRVLSKAIV